MGLVTVTRKIQLVINTPNEDDKADFRAQLTAWRDICVQVANWLVTEMYITLKGDSVSFLREKTKAEMSRPENFADLDKKEQKEFIKQENKFIYDLIAEEKKEFMPKTELTYYYNLLSKYYKTSIKTAVLSAINSTMIQNFNAEKKDYILNKKSLRTYKDTLPIPITAQSIRSVRRSTDETGKVYRDFAFNIFGIPLRTYLGKDKSNNEVLLKEAFSAWFLPDAIWDREALLSEEILKLREGQRDRDSNVVQIKDIAVKFDYEELEKGQMKGARLNEGRHRYVIKVSISDKEETFFMEAMKPVKNPKTKEPEIKGYKIVSNIKLSDSGLQLKHEVMRSKNGKEFLGTKFFFLATFRLEAKKPYLDPDKVAYCELGVDIPIKVTIGTKEFSIGNKDDLYFRRIGIQGSLREKQRNIKGTKGGRGRKRKLRPLGRFKNYEKNVVNDKIHNYSNKLIALCLKNQCKTIFLVNQKQKEMEAKEDELLLRNWGYHGMKNFINYKAAMVTIDVFEKDKD